MATNQNRDPFQDTTVDLLEWFQQQKDTRISPKVRIDDLRRFGQGRGVVAAADIEEDEELFTVPNSSILTVESSSLFNHLREDLRKLPYWAALVLTLIHEHGKGIGSTWFPYTCIFPFKVDTLMSWSPAELAELQASTVLNRIGKESADDLFENDLYPIAKANASHFGRWAGVFASLDGKATFMRLCHRWASLIFAYGFDLDPDMASDREEEVDENGMNDEVKKGMVPLADMLNADGDLNNAHLVQNEDSVTMTAIKSIKAGNQIFNDFGQLPRSEMLRCYGYITDRYKKWDVAEVSLDLIKSVITNTEAGQPLTEEDVENRFSIAEDWEVLDDGYDLTWPEASGVRTDLPANLILVVNALRLSPADYDREKASKSKPLKTNVFMRPMSMYLMWRNILTKRLQQYGTTVAEDHEVLQSLRSAERQYAETNDPIIEPSEQLQKQRMAVEVRLGEKEILARWLEEIDKLSNSMSSHTQEEHKSIPRVKKMKI